MMSERLLADAILFHVSGSEFHAAFQKANELDRRRERDNVLQDSLYVSALGTG